MAVICKYVTNAIEKAVSMSPVRKNSTRQKGKKIQLSTVSKFRVQQYEDVWPTKAGKPWREKGSAHADMVSERFANLKAKGGRLANSRDVDPLETTWSTVYETT